MATRNRKVVPGSEKKALPKAKVIGKPDPEERIEVTVLLRRRAAGASPRARKAAAAKAMTAAAKLPEQRVYLSREAFAAEAGADPADVAKVEAFAQEHNLTVVEASLSKRSVRLAGTIGDLGKAFGVTLKNSRLGSRVFRSRTGAISVPAQLLARADEVIE